MTRKEKRVKRKNRKIKKIVEILLILLISILVYIILREVVLKKINNIDIANTLETIEIPSELVNEENTERMLQISELKKENSEIVGWLEVNNTNINYPVLQTTNNDYYMTNTYKHEYSKDGSLFLDKSYDWNIPSSNLLIYGHNNLNGTMFQDLLKYKEQDFYNKNKTFRFTTVAEDSEYEIIAVFETRVFFKNEEDVFRYYYFINAENEEEYKNYIEESKKASLYEIETTAEYGEQLITLSTCSYHEENGRFVVVAKKIEK